MKNPRDIARELTQLGEQIEMISPSEAAQIETLTGKIERALGYSAEGDIISRLEYILSTVTKISQSVDHMERLVKITQALLDDKPSP